MQEQMRSRRYAVAFVAGAVAVAAASGWTFAAMHEAEPIVAGPGVTAERTLSDIQANLKGSGGDTPVFELAGREPGGTLLVIGGTHPSEIAGMMAAVLLIENARVAKGRLVVVPQANRSGFTHTEPMGAFFHSYEIVRPDGSKRWFRVGMRLTNPADQWPDPDVYVHMPTGEQMIGLESRNLNRNHPGLLRGTLTAEVSSALTSLARQADVVFDLHETRPEGTLNNTIVAHQRAFETAAYAVEFLKGAGLSIKYERSPVNLHGLSHREFGDFTKAQAVLAETTNPAQGLFRGRLSEDLLLRGRDANYVQAAKLGRLFVAFDDSGSPLERRVGRHLESVKAIVGAYNELNPRNPIVIEGIPGHEELAAKGLGAFLQPVPRS
jgi:predicted deacylase